MLERVYIHYVINETSWKYVSSILGEVNFALGVLLWDVINARCWMVKIFIFFILGSQTKIKSFMTKGEFEKFI